MVRLEERLLSKEETLDSRLAGLAEREQELLVSTEENAGAKERHIRELERVSGLSASQAKQILLHELEDQIRHDSARRVRQIEEETKRDADRRVRNILSVVMQRMAAGHAAETTVSVVQLSSDDMKGRIIGREGRNIRALENLTGVDFIIDDTPNAVVLSGFDGVRREIARITLEKLLADGRIHPARIEEAFYQAKSELESHIVECGEKACFDANVGAIDPEMTRLLGRLKYRTSYGQNVLAHSVECANLAAMMAHELGASPKTARRAALLHDIGKAVSHEVEGPHALVGGDLARKHGEPEAVAHAMEAHHNEVEPQTVEAVIVQAADALSGARPGARGESLESYVKRLRDLEHIATRHEGVDKVYAMQAGREIRVMVMPRLARRRRRGAALARDRARDRAGARVPRPDQGDRDPRVAGDGLRAVKSFHVTTFGCQMNEHDSERMKGMLESLGYAEAAERADADLILFNTCSIREKADCRFIAHLGEAKRLKREDPERIVGVGGCWAQSVKEEVFQRFPFVDVAFGPGQVHKLAEFLTTDSLTAQGFFEFEGFTGHLPDKRAREFQAWVQISVGCNCACSYCIVPSTRGREVSRPQAELVAEVRRLAADGVREVTLLGQNVNSYGRDLRPRAAFSELLTAVDAVDGIERIRYTSPHPKDMREDVIRAHAELAALCEHIHLPLQSGSSRVLKAMRRTYTRERYLDRVALIREHVPDVRADHRRHRRLPRRDRGGLRADARGRRGGRLRRRVHLRLLAAPRHRGRRTPRPGAPRGQGGAHGAPRGGRPASRRASAPSASSAARSTSWSREPRAPTRRACAAARATTRS